MGALAGGKGDKAQTVEAWDEPALETGISVNHDFKDIVLN